MGDARPTYPRLRKQPNETPEQELRRLQHDEMVLEESEANGWCMTDQLIEVRRRIRELKEGTQV